jgi:hypothetical protein
VATPKSALLVALRRKRLRASLRQSGSGSCIAAYPGLTSGATFRRRYAAGSVLGALLITAGLETLKKLFKLMNRRERKPERIETENRKGKKQRAKS